MKQNIRLKTNHHIASFSKMVTYLFDIGSKAAYIYNIKHLNIL